MLEEKKQLKILLEFKMEEFKLVGIAPDGKEGFVWACGKCKRTALNETAARNCCTCYKCHTPLTEEELKRQYYPCKKCKEESEKDRRKKEKDKENNAEIIKDYDGPVYCSRLDRFEDSLDSMIEAWYDHLWWEIHKNYEVGEDIPEEEYLKHLPDYVYCCHVKPACSIDTSDIVNMLENTDLPEEIDPADFNGYEELEKALEAFNNKNESFKVWEPDFTRKVKLK